MTRRRLRRLGLVGLLLLAGLAVVGLAAAPHGLEVDVLLAVGVLLVFGAGLLAAGGRGGPGE